MCNNFTVIDASFANHNKSEVRSQIITRENNVLKKIVAPLQVKGLFEYISTVMCKHQKPAGENLIVILKEPECI